MIDEINGDWVLQEVTGEPASDIERRRDSLCYPFLSSAV
jgi:hypothetical protein